MMVAMNFRMFLHLIHGLRDDCVVKDLSLDELDIYLTKSDGKVVFGVSIGFLFCISFNLLSLSF